MGPVRDRRDSYPHRPLFLVQTFRSESLRISQLLHVFTRFGKSPLITSIVPYGFSFTGFQLSPPRVTRIATGSAVQVK
jgi:hypothetical protein